MTRFRTLAMILLTITLLAAACGDETETAAVGDEPTLDPADSSDAEKRAKADHVIDTGKGMDAARQQVEQVIQHIRSQAHA